jgi:DNA/RNA endonuclease YhcR with UshA esterase domain
VAINKIGWLTIFFLSFMMLSPVMIPAQVKAVPLSDIGTGKIGETFSVQGRIVSIIPPRGDTAPYSIYLTDDTETLLVVVWEKVMSQIPFREQLKPDAHVIVTGALKEYRSNLNFYLTEPGNILLQGADLSPANIKKTAPDTPEPAQELPPGVFPPSRIERSQMGQQVTIQGMVREYRAARSETAPHSIFLEDGSGSLRVVYWSEVARALGSQNVPQPGQKLRIQGTVDEYREELQLRVNNARDIIPVKADESRQNLKSTGSIPLGSIAQTHKGQQVSITGRIIDLNPPQNPQDPNKATLMDGTGALIVLYNQDVAESPESSTASQGKSPDLQGTMENPIDLPINSITTDHQGLYVKTKGKVVNLTPSWQETAPNVATISSGNATVDIVYWNDVAEKIPAEKKPEVNKVIQITGKVREFKDELQIKIYKPEDIIALSETQESSSSDSDAKQTPTVDQAPAQEKGTDKDPLSLPISAVTKKLEEKYVIIKGKVMDVKPSWQPSAPNKVTLSDDKGKIVVVYWADVADRLTEGQKPKTGQMIQVKGKVSSYRDELQVKLNEPADLAIMDKNP